MFPSHKHPEMSMNSHFVKGQTMAHFRMSGLARKHILCLQLKWSKNETNCRNSESEFKRGVSEWKM